MLTRDDLLSLEVYAGRAGGVPRPRDGPQEGAGRQLGGFASIHFEDALTIAYQVQEMLRLERIFEPDLIQAELDVYNPLVPDGSNWKATLMFEYPDAEERSDALGRPSGSRRRPMSSSTTTPASRPSPTRTSTARRRRRPRPCISCASS